MLHYIFHQVYNAYQALLNGLDVMLQVCHNLPMLPTESADRNANFTNVRKKKIFLRASGNTFTSSHICVVSWIFLAWKWQQLLPFYRDVLFTRDILCICLIFSSSVCLFSNCLGVGWWQVHSTSKKLLYQLDHLVQVCNQPGTERKHVNIIYFLFSY